MHISTIPAPTSPIPVVRVRNLRVGLRREGGAVELVSGVSFDLAAGEILALVGESGCGKSVSCLALGRLLPEPPFTATADELMVAGRDVNRLGAKELRALRGGVLAYIFQDPGAALNPVLRVGTQLAEALRLHHPGLKDVTARCVELLREVGIPEPELRLRAYPHELSGGMQQRVMTAMAVSSRPAVLVADEPTTALDVTVQAQILELLGRLRRERNMAVLLVTHNLGIVAGMADRVCVMYAGEIVETAPTAELLRAPRHPYTRALLDAVPRLGAGRGELTSIPGRVPAPGEYPAGCRFAERCPRVQPACRAAPPPWIEPAPNRGVRCRLPLG